MTTSNLKLPKPYFDGEEFRLVPGYEAYCVSNYGRLFTRWHRVNRIPQLGSVWKPVKATPTKQGHYHVGLCSASHSHQNSTMIHRLVLEVFVCPCPAGLEGCHNDGNPSNNYVGNLRWDTRQANMRDKEKHGRCKLPDNNGARNGKSKLTQIQVNEIRSKKFLGWTTKDLAKEYNVSSGTIYYIISGRSWSK